MNDGGPAFPFTFDDIDSTCSGMSLRDYFAAAALQACLHKMNYSYGGDENYAWFQKQQAKAAIAKAMGER